VTNVPSITIEEVVPGGVSDSTRLAPEEIYDKKRGELVVVSHFLFLFLFSFFPFSFFLFSFFFFLFFSFLFSLFAG